jgi:molecular chaperone GrpE (heat shock protein)
MPGNDLQTALCAAVLHVLIGVPARKKKELVLGRKKLWLILVHTEKGRNEISKLLKFAASDNESRKALTAAAPLTDKELGLAGPDAIAGLLTIIVRDIVENDIDIVRQKALLKGLNLLLKRPEASKADLDSGAIGRFVQLVGTSDWKEKELSAPLELLEKVNKTWPSASDDVMLSLTRLCKTHQQRLIEAMRQNKSSLFSMILKPSNSEQAKTLVSYLSGGDIAKDVSIEKTHAVALKQIYILSDSGRASYEKAARKIVTQLLPEEAARISELETTVKNLPTLIDNAVASVKQKLTSVENQRDLFEGQLKDSEAKRGDAQRQLSESREARTNLSVDQEKRALRAYVHDAVKLVLPLTRESPELGEFFCKVMEGLESIATEGEVVPFNPDIHSAVGIDIQDKGAAVVVIQVGYSWYGSVLEPALVRPQ